jgi:hypothetical protein
MIDYQRIGARSWKVYNNEYSFPSKLDFLRLVVNVR